ncbi:MAG: hypothetical protein DRR42_24605 [Gammaproteobacteria bacterium]|nr:MAG: hypothetical protein DRR42_24605 [Gammaproteobacteria bacterium]
MEGFGKVKKGLEEPVAKACVPPPGNLVIYSPSTISSDKQDAGVELVQQQDVNTDIESRDLHALLQRVTRPPQAEM